MTALLEIEGNLGADPVVNHTRDGKPVLNLRVAHTPRRFDREKNEWVDAGETLWVSASCWRNPEALVRLLRSGSRVVVKGEPVLRPWERDGRSGVSLEIPSAHIALIPREQGAPGAQAAPPAPDAGWYSDDVPW